VRALLLALGLGALGPAASATRLDAQTPSLEESRRRLDEIRKERESLESDRERLQGQVHDLTEELDNLERQRQATNRIVNELDAQIGVLNRQADQINVELVLTQDNLAERRAVLERRLIDIYKRGRLYSFQVLVAAESFGDLVSRYKYLFLTSRQDRALVADVERLRDQVAKRRSQIVMVRTDLARNREEREGELARYSDLALEGSRRLREAKRSSRTTEQRLTALERDEQRLNDVIASFERERLGRERASAAGAARAAGSLSTSDIGKLDWPVEGRILYRFGRDTLASGGVIRHNGIGIGAPPGTPVKAVESGRIILAQLMQTYGLSVLLDHGNGYYSFYSHLGSMAVKQGTTVTRGQVLGTVGGENSDEGPHLYFEIRGESGIALDPAEWLKKRR
jgi:septal ring factor EnvC (AmiA/AmiB activator)